MLESEPDWARFNDQHKFTIAVKNYHTNRNLGGGPITNGILRTSAEEPIRTPVVGMVEEITHFGYYKINRIQLSESEQS